MIRMVPTVWLSAPAAALVWLALALAGCGGVPPEVQRARAHFDARDYEQAHIAARAALARPPGHPEAWRIDIQSLFNLGRADEAVAAYRQRYRVYHDHDRALLSRIALSTLWQGLRVPSAQVQVRAIQAVERHELEKLARDVEARIGDDNDAVAAAAAVALLRSRWGAPEIAGQLLASENPLARAIAVEGIGRKVGERARADLLAALRDRDPRVRRAGVLAVAAMKLPEDTAALGRLAAEDPDPEVRVAALAGLAMGKRAGAADFAMRALDAGEPVMQPMVRLAGVELLGELGERDRLQRIAVDPNLAHEAPWLALQALLVQARIAGKSPVDPGALWQRALAHGSWARSWEVRAASARALVPGRRAVADPRQAVSLLEPMLDDQDGRVRVAVALALSQLSHQLGLIRLADLCRDPDPAVREAALAAHADLKLVSIGLVASLADESALIRVQAADTILSALR